MAEEKELEQLTPYDRRVFQSIYLYDDKESVLVEDCKWMPPFVGRNHPVRETKILYVPVQSCDEAMASARVRLGIR